MWAFCGRVYPKHRVQSWTDRILGDGTERVGDKDALGALTVFVANYGRTTVVAVTRGGKYVLVYGVLLDTTKEGFG